MNSITAHKCKGILNSVTPKKLHLFVGMVKNGLYQKNILSRFGVSAYIWDGEGMVFTATSFSKNK